MTQNLHNIAVLLATRGRTATLERSVRSLFELAADPERIQILLAFDRDDTVGVPFFTQTLQPWMDRQGINYRAMLFDRMGYVRLNRYYNELAPHASAEWLIVWNDDAAMETQGWDSVIMQHSGEFKLLAFHTHRDHPYSIFPILPRKWYELTGYISPHPSQDAWLSQQAYMLDIWERIPVDVTHDRFDLTGNNQDSTFQERQILEGNPSDPRDFHSTENMNLRHQDSFKLAAYLKNVLGQDMTFFENVFTGKQNPWEKLAKNDVNQQMRQFANPHIHTDHKES
jgi:hypothetical protein